MYADAVPVVVQQLITFLEVVGLTTPDLFAGDPTVRDINDLIDDLNAMGEHADVDRAARGDAHLAASTLAAYVRNLPEALLPSPHYEQMCSALDVEVYVERIAALRDIVAEMPEANVVVMHRVLHFLARIGERGSQYGNGLDMRVDVVLSNACPEGGLKVGGLRQPPGS